MNNIMDLSSPAASPQRDKDKGSPPRIWLSPPHMDGQERRFVNEAFDTNWIAPLGPHVDGFEADLQQYTGVDHAAALTSGTAALHLALLLLGVRAGHTVICQSMTFSASANPVAYLGATPVFVDSETDTWNMCPGALEEAIDDLTAPGPAPNAPGPAPNAHRPAPSALRPAPNAHRPAPSALRSRPKAIIAVDLYGMPARLEEITAVGARHGIPVIEDAAEALGASINGKMCGSFGQLGVLSFNGNKIITTSGGGALLSNNGDLIRKARFLATQARDNAPHYQHSHIGYNYRMSNVLAAIGRGQMRVINDRVNKRRANFERYKAFFAGINDRGFRIELQPEPEGYLSNRWLTAMLVDPTKNKGITREKLQQALENQNIESRPLWKPMHLQPVFAGTGFYGNGTSERLFNHGLCLPSGSSLSEEDFDRIFAVLHQVFQ